MSNPLHMTKYCVRNTVPLIRLYGKYVLFKRKQWETASVVVGTRLTAFDSTKAFGCKDITLSLYHPLPVLGLCCSWTLLAASYVFTPITLDLLMPLNESRKRYFSLLTMFSYDRIEYVDMVYVNILVVYTIGLLCVAGTDLTFVVFAHYICGMFEITRYEWKCWLFSNIYLTSLTTLECSWLSGQHTMSKIFTQWHLNREHLLQRIINVVEF